MDMEIAIQEVVFVPPYEFQLVLVAVYSKNDRLLSPSHLSSPIPSSLHLFSHLSEPSPIYLAKPFLVFTPDFCISTYKTLSHNEDRK